MNRQIVVYGPPGSPFVEKVMLGFAFKGLPEPQVEAPQSVEDFRRWNPETGMLPVMEFDGARVPDSSGILDFLDARFPEPPLVARDPWVARQQRQLESWIGESFFFYWVRWLRANVAPKDVDPSKSTELQRMGILGRIGELLASGPSLPGDLGPEFQRRLDDLVGFLGARPFFHADRPSRADLTAAAFLASLEAGTVPGGKHMLAARPSLVALLGRVREVTGRG